VANSSSNLPDGMTVASFENNDGSKVVVVLNVSDVRRKYNVRCGNRKFLYNQLAKSVVSFKF
jgi:O-glycosyl hydrolase